MSDHPPPLARILDDQAVLDVRGDDARVWLQGQLTADVARGAREAPDAGVYGLVVDLKGKIVADVWTLHRADGHRLLLPADALDAAVERLDAFVVMEDVELVPRPDLAVVSVQGAGAGALVAGLGEVEAARVDRLGLGEGVELVVARAEAPRWLARLVEGGARQADEAAWALARIEAGVPAFGPDFGPGRFPQEAGVKARAVSFQKGCYLGQEAVHMLEMRGKVKRRVVRVSGVGEAPAAGAEVLDGAGQVVGVLGSTALDAASGAVRGFAFVRTEHAVAGTPLRAGPLALKVEGEAGAADEPTV